MYENMNLLFKIAIQYDQRDGVHMLKSDDVPGLMVVNKDFQVVIRDLGPSVEMCFRLNKGLDVEFIGLVKPFAEIDEIDAAEYDSPPPAWLTDAAQEVVLRRR